MPTQHCKADTQLPQDQPMAVQPQLPSSTTESIGSERGEKSVRWFVVSQQDHSLESVQVEHGPPF